MLSLIRRMGNSLFMTCLGFQIIMGTWDLGTIQPMLRIGGMNSGTALMIVIALRLQSRE